MLLVAARSGFLPVYGNSGPHWPRSTFCVAPARGRLPPTRAGAERDGPGRGRLTAVLREGRGAGSLPMFPTASLLSGGGDGASPSPLPSAEGEPSAAQESGDPTVINWSVPPGAAPDWLMGAGATPAERALIWAGSLVGVALIVYMFLRGEPGGWATWQYLLAAFLAWDVVGGAVSNAASSTKRQYFGPDFANAAGIGRIVRSPVLFTLLHVHPFIVIACYPGGTWAWATALYMGAVAGAVLVDRVVPQYLQRPVAMLVFCTVLLLVPCWAAPAGWAWFALTFLAKLVLAHAVREEPYRPTPTT